jgi:hypothetical protein
VTRQSVVCVRVTGAAEGGAGACVRGCTLASSSAARYLALVPNTVTLHIERGRDSHRDRQTDGQPHKHAKREGVYVHDRVRLSASLRVQWTVVPVVCARKGDEGTRANAWAYPSSSTSCHRRSGSGLNGDPSNRTMVAPTASAPTSQFHIIHPVVVYCKTTSVRRTSPCRQCSFLCWSNGPWHRRTRRQTHRPRQRQRERGRGTSRQQGAAMACSCASSHTSAQSRLLGRACTCMCMCLRMYVYVYVYVFVCERTDGVPRPSARGTWDGPWSPTKTEYTRGDRTATGQS